MHTKAPIIPSPTPAADVAPLVSPDKVGDVETQNLCLTFRPEQPIKVILTMMQKTRTGAACVIDAKSKLVGILTEREILRHVFALLDDQNINFSDSSRLVAELKVSDVMTPQPEVLVDTMAAEDALTLMTKLGYRYMPIVSHDDPTRMLGIADERELALHVGNRLADARTEMAAKDVLLVHMLSEPYGLGYKPEPDAVVKPS